MGEVVYGFSCWAIVLGDAIVYLWRLLCNHVFFVRLMYSENVAG